MYGHIYHPCRMAALTASEDVQRDIYSPNSYQEASVFNMHVTLKKVTCFPFLTESSQWEANHNWCRKCRRVCLEKLPLMSFHATNIRKSLCR